MSFTKGGAGPGGSGGTPDTTTEGAIPKKEGNKFVDSAIKETSKITISKKTQVADMVVTNELSAKKLKTAEPSVGLGSGLKVGAAGGEVIYTDSTTPTETKHFGPRKQVDISGGTGTGNNFTIGRSVLAFSDVVVQPGFALRSDDPTAQIGENAFDINNVEFLLTTDPGEDFVVRKYRFRFDTVETGLRFVVRKDNRTNTPIFASTEDFLWDLGEGFTSQIYDGTPSSETILDLEENPQMLRANTLYHITLEKFEGAVVSLGAIVGSEFITYFSRETFDALVDPVVATGVLNVASNLAMDESSWYTLVFIDATAGPVNLTLPSATAGVFSGLPMYVIRIDSTANAVNVLPFAGQDVNGESSRPLSQQYSAIALVSDGANVKILNERPLYPVGDLLFADTNGEPTTNPLLRWDNNGNIFLFEKTAIGLVAVLGNGKIANNGPNSFILQHRNFLGADVDVGFGQDNLGKIIIGSANENIELSTGVQGNILGLTVEDSTGNVVIEKQVQIKGGNPALDTVLSPDGTGLAVWKTGLYNDTEKQISYGSATTGIIADVRDIIEVDPLDDTKIKIKAPYTLRTVDVTTPSSINTKSLDVPITSGIAHDIPPGFTYWIGVKDNAGVPLYNFHFTLEEFDLTEFAILGKAFTDETIPLQLNGLVGTSWWEGWNYGKTLYDFATARNLSFDLSGGGVTPDAGLLTYTREEGSYWRFMFYDDLKNPNKGTDPQTAITAYFTYPSVGAFEQSSTFEVGFFESAGVKTAVPINKWSIYKVFHFASSNFESAQRGKQTYDSLHDAKSRKGEEDLPLNTDLENAAFTHIAYVKSGATDLTNSEEVVFEKINPNSLSSGGDPLISSLQGSGLIDWVGTDIMEIDVNTAQFKTGQFRVGKVDRTGTGEVKFIRTVAATTGNILTKIATQPFTHIAYDIDNDVFVNHTGVFNRGVLGNIIPLGFIWHRNSTSIDKINNMPMTFEVSHDYVGQLLSFGGMKQNGLSLSPNGANKKLNTSTGTIEVLGGNSLVRENISTSSPIALIPLTFTPVHRAVTTGKAIFGTPIDDPDYTVFDDGSGTLAVLSNVNKFGVHYIYIFPFRFTLEAFLIHGSKEYDNFDAAKDGVNEDTPPIPTDFIGGFLIGVVIAKKDTTNLTSGITNLTVKIVDSDRFGSFGGGGGGGGGSTATLQSAYEAGTEPEILTNSTRGAFTLKRGSAADTDKVIEVQDGIGTSQFSVDGNGLIIVGTGTTLGDGITISKTAPHLYLNATAATADNRLWDFLALNATLSGRAINDANSIAGNWIDIHRTTTTIDDVTFPNGRLIIDNQLQVKGGSPAAGLFLGTDDATGLCSFKVVTASASGADGSIQFATVGALNSDVTNFSWDNSLDVFKLGKTTTGQVAEIGNAIVRNRGANDWAIKHKDFIAVADDNVGFGLNQGGKVTIGATLDNTIDLLTGDGVTAPTLKVQVLGTGNVIINEFTKLGSTAPNIKMKKLTGTTGATEGSSTNISHGLTLNKIIGLSVLVVADNGNVIPPGLVFASGFQYDAFMTPTNVTITLSATNSSNMLSNAITVSLTYEE